MIVKNFKKKIFFWQQFVSPHIAYLIDQIASKNLDVKLLAKKFHNINRRKLGWKKFKLNYVRPIILKDINSKPVDKFFTDGSIHLCEGLFFNGFVQKVQTKLRNNNSNQWILMEKINDDGFVGILKKLLYFFLFLIWKKKINGVLAIGNGACEWYARRGFDKDKIFPFAYFLNDTILKTKSTSHKNPIFKFIFVGELIKRKNVYLLIDALSLLKIKEDFKLEIIGGGPLRKDLINYAKKILPNKVTWINTMPISEIPNKISDADCLVLPSYFDGWGAVVSESLMVGTPVICSDRCGSSEIVKKSKFGFIFKNNDINDLSLKLKKMIQKGKVSKKKRKTLKKWANCLGANSGADYLIKIFFYSLKIGKRPNPPWENNW